MRQLYTRHRPFGPRVTITRMSGPGTPWRTATYVRWMGPAQTAMSPGGHAVEHNTGLMTASLEVYARRTASGVHGYGVSAGWQGTVSTQGRATHATA